MAEQDTIFGRQPGPNGDVGVGEVAQNETRLTFFAQPADDYWLTHLGAHVGWDQSGTAPAATVAVYNTSGGNASTLLAKTAAFTTRARYFPTDPYGGESVTKKLPAPAILKRNQLFLGGVHAANRWMTHAMNNDGSQMSRDYGNTSPPATFQTEVKNAQGRISVWGVVRKNSAPSAPTNVEPTPGGQTTDLNPTIAGDFRDPDEKLTDFGIGSADKMSAYQVIVYNDTKTAVIWDSGVKTATTAQQAARRFDIEVPVTVPAGGRYTVQARVRDLVGAWSGTTEWKFSVFSSGSAEVTAPVGMVTSTTPNITFKYTHRDNVAMASIDVQVVNVLARVLSEALGDPGGGISHGPVNIPMSLAAGGSGTITYASTGFAALSRGPAGLSHVQVRPVDANGVPGAWSPLSDAYSFRVNALPPAPVPVSPEAGEVRTSPGVFRITAAADADGDSPSTYTATAYVREVAGPGPETAFPLSYQSMSGAAAVFEGTPPASAFDDYAQYEWRVRVTDQLGGQSALTSWTAFNYAEPPAITITAPAGTTVSLATQTVTYTSTPAAAKQRVRWIDAVTREVVHDSGLDPATGSDQVHVGEVRHGRQYDIVVGVQTGLGAYGEVTKRVTASFPLPVTPTNQTLTLQYGDYDIEGQPTLMALQFTRPAGAEESSFRGFGIYALQPDGTVRRVEVITDYNANIAYYDEAPLNGTVSMWATYYKDEGLDLLESDPPAVKPTLSMNFGGTVVSDLANPGINRIVARYWLTRREVPVRAQETHEGWGQYPTLFSGERDYRRMQGVWDLHDEEGFTATELKDAISRITKPIIEQVPIASGEHTMPSLRSRYLCLRDGLGRVIYGHLKVEIIEDTKREPHDITWEFIETGPPASVPAPAPKDPAVMTAVNTLIHALEGLLGG